MASIQGVYVALFGRPADPTGLAYFNTATNNGNDLTKIGDLASTQEYKDRFAGQNNVQIVSAIYQSLFNRAPEASGLNFFVNALNTGSLNINNIAIAILDGAQGSDKTIVDAKIASANTFTARLDTAVEIGTYVGNDAAAQGRAFLAGVTTTPKTAAEADTAIANLNVGNATITLTAAAEVVSTTATAASLKSTNSNDTIDAATVADTLNAGDKIDAGLGFDTLNVAATGASVTPLQLTSVEKVVLTQTTAAGGIDFTNATGLQEVWSKASTAAVTFGSLDGTVKLGVEGVNTANVTFNYKAADVAGTADAATLNIKGANITGATVTINAVETLNIVTSGSALVAGATGFIAGDAIKDVKITGEIGGVFNFTAPTTLKTVDASGVNGSGVTIDLGAATKGVTVTGSKFKDTIDLSSVADTKDVVVYNAGNTSNLTQQDTITGFQAGFDKLDLSAFALSGAKAAVTAFGAAPIEGSNFLGNALGYFNNVVYADTNNDGIFNAATDFAVTLAGGVAVADVIFA